MNSFLGYRRADGTVGIRNHVVVIPSVSCANGVVAAIAREVPELVPLYHGHGCGRGGQDAERHLKTLVNLGRHPNVAGVLIIGLGCEVIRGEFLLEGIKPSGKPVELLNIQSEGGSQKTARKGITIARKMLQEVESLKKEAVPWSSLILGLECGGSDAFSGVTANSAVGKVSDWLVAKGGTVILTENTEMIGTCHILKARSCTEQVGADVEDMINRAETRSREILGPHAIAAISPGNMDGGMSSIMEKSLGCIIKGGTTPINQVLAYGEVPSAKGLVLMDAPGYDTESMAGMVAGGAQLMLFTTGRGNPLGFPTVPVIKIASTSRLFESMNDDMDINAGEILDGKSIDEVGQTIIEKIIRVIEGEQTRAETNRQDGILCLYTAYASM